MGVIHIFEIVQMVPNCPKRHIEDLNHKSVLNMDIEL